MELYSVVTGLVFLWISESRIYISNDVYTLHSEALSIDPQVCIEKEHISCSDCSFSDISNVHKMHLPHSFVQKGNCSVESKGISIPMKY
ncbi:hypothetical protein CUMW_062240 [Citrus unshiu]|uniref:Uncharacterized protein n=1 Tax=Citrus unshiu TaxID=55188 RepID=A0A2H5NNQ1_CITUN|nr:hypothetical protein CUMW_062240 [Citrus unshiu]